MRGDISLNLVIFGSVFMSEINNHKNIFFKIKYAQKYVQFLFQTKQKAQNTEKSMF